VYTYVYSQLFPNRHSRKRTALLTDTVFNSPFLPLSLLITLISGQLYLRTLFPIPEDVRLWESWLYNKFLHPNLVPSVFQFQDGSWSKSPGNEATDFPSLSFTSLLNAKKDLESCGIWNNAVVNRWTWRLQEHQPPHRVKLRQMCHNFELYVIWPRTKLPLHWKKKSWK